MPKAAALSRAVGTRASTRPVAGPLTSRPFATAKELAAPDRVPAEPMSAASGPSFSFGRLALQRKLTVGRSDDPLERQADQVAERVMRMPEPSAWGGMVQRKCAACADEDRLQRKSLDTQVADIAAPPIVNDVLRSPGRPIDPRTRSVLEPRFGRDFGNVRVHTEGLASQSAEALMARAYTVGRDIAFRRGEYAPDTIAGRSLLAHELAHVVQQGQARETHTWAKPRIQANAVSGRVQRDDETPPEQSNTPNLEQEYQTAVRMGDWQAAAEWLNAFNREDIQAHLALLTTDQVRALHQGAIDNPRVGPQSQIAQLTEPGTPPASMPPPLASTAPPPPAASLQAPTTAPQAAAVLDETPQMSIPTKLVEAIRRGMQSDQLDKTVIAQLNALLDPEAVSIAILFWIASHYDGLGEFLDVAALIFKGLQFKAVLEDLWDYATIAIAAQTKHDLDRAAEKFANAVVAAGVLKLLSIIEEFGGKRKGAGEAETAAEEGRPANEKEERQGTEEERVPQELKGFCEVGSLNCSAFPETVLDEVGEAPHQDRCPMEKGPWKLRGKGDPEYDRLRREDTDTRNEKYLSRPDLWSPEFRDAYTKAGNTWPETNGEPWQVHHRKPLDFGGSNEVENFVALERPVHAEITSYYARLKAAMARPFGGVASPEWKSIRVGETDVDL
jgi:Domain of unknown function (DUF4157)